LISNFTISTAEWIKNTLEPYAKKFPTFFKNRNNILTWDIQFKDLYYSQFLFRILLLLKDLRKSKSRKEQFLFIKEIKNEYESLEFPVYNLLNFKHKKKMEEITKSDFFNFFYFISFKLKSFLITNKASDSKNSIICLHNLLETEFRNRHPYYYDPLTFKKSYGKLNGNLLESIKKRHKLISKHLKLGTFQDKILTFNKKSN